MTSLPGTEAHQEWAARFKPESPFAELLPEAETDIRPVGYTPWSEGPSPFAEFAESNSAGSSSLESVLTEAFEALRDDSFDEALANLVSETEEAVSDRFESAATATLVPERQRLAEAHLAPVQLEALSYLERLQDSLGGADIEALPAQQLDELLDAADPKPADISPAGEDFIGALARKAKDAVRFVAKTASKVGRAVGSVVGGVLKRLYGLIRPLLRRVLGFAIGRLPEPLRAPARLLAGKIGLEIEAEDTPKASTLAVDPQTLAESLDAALAETIVTGEGVPSELEGPAGYEAEYEDLDSQELELLAEARSVLIDRLGGATGPNDVAVAVEQFVPALLGVLRIGINLIGRPKVVEFLAKYLAQLIGKWVGPNLAGPLSTAIVDTGLRLITLEQEEQPAPAGEAAPALLAATVEDTIRRLAEVQSYVLEDEELLQFAVGEAFDEAVATHFPAQLVRQDLQLAPSLRGSFVPKQPRQVHTFKKYSRVPEVEIAPAIAAQIRTFGGTTLAASLAACGIRLPARFRVHIYEATAGTTLLRIARLERRIRGLGRGTTDTSGFHPLDVHNAGLLLREPRLGVNVPARYRRSRRRIAVGQRFVYLEPVNAAARVAVPYQRAGAQRAAPSQGWIRVNLARSEVSVALFFSESDAQTIAASVNQGRSTQALLKALASAYDAVSRSFDDPSGRVIFEAEQDEQFVATALQRLAPYLRDMLKQKLKEWVLRMLADWARARAGEFARAAANPADGVTVMLRLRDVPGLPVLQKALNGQLDAAALRALTPSSLFQGVPTMIIEVVPGQRRP
jgi:hypothetical protein